MREQDRQQALVMQLAMMTANFRDADRKKLQRDINTLRRYPVLKLEGD